MNGPVALAKRAVACTGWRWLGGMLCLVDADDYSARVVAVGATLRTTETCDTYAEGNIIVRSRLSEKSLPDLKDPATIGCLLGLVREAWSMFDAVAMLEADEHGEWWVVGTRHGDYLCEPCDTEAEALVSALETGAISILETTGTS